MNEKVLFHGREGEACEGFIRTVREVAFGLGKIRDDAWMADFASTCLDGSALRLYESLDPATQSDWGRLRQALLTKYPPLDEVGGTPPGNPREYQDILAAGNAAAPPPQPRKGRLKVIGEHSMDFGYIGDGSTSHGGCVGGGASVGDALLFSYIPGGKLYEIGIERAGDTKQVLGMHWLSTSPSRVIGSSDHAVVTAFDCVGAHRSSPKSQEGPGQTSIWNVRPDNTVWPYFEEYRCECTALRVFSHGNSGNQRFCLLVAADPPANFIGNSRPLSKSLLFLALYFLLYLNEWARGG